MKIKVKDFEIISKKLKLMSHPVRLSILTNIYEYKELNVSYLQKKLNIPRSTISQHIQKLRSAKIISYRKEGIEIYYSVLDNDVVKLIKFISEK